MTFSKINQLHRFPGVREIGIFFFAYLYLPIVILVVLSFNENRSATIWTGFTFDWYSTVFINKSIIAAAQNSLVVATIATVVSTALATTAALGVTNLSAARPLRGESSANAVIALPLVVPQVVTAVASLLFFVMLANYLGMFRLGLFTVTIAHIVFCIPFAYLPIRARLHGIDKFLHEAAADLYGTEWQIFWRITLPLLWPGILAGAMLAFITSIDDFVITSFVAGAGASTLPIYIYSLIRAGISPEVNAVSAMMLIVSVLCVSLSLLLSRRKT